MAPLHGQTAPSGAHNVPDPAEEGERTPGSALPPRTGAAYFGNRFAAHGERDMAALAECCDYVVHTLSETDFFYHKSALGKIVDISRRRGLEVWIDPWGVGGVFGGEALSKFLLDNPGEWQERSDARRAPAACLNSRRFRDFVKEWILTAAGMGAQVVFWDEPHFFFQWDLEMEGTYACVCPRCADLYRREVGGAFPKKLDEPAAEFRRRTLTHFLTELMAYARRKGLRNALCLYAFDGYAEYDRIWRALGSLPLLDIFGCDPYWRWRPRAQDPARHVAAYTRRVREVAAPGGKGVQIWVQAMRLPRGKEHEIATALSAAVSAGATHLAAWSFDGGALLDPVLAEDPAAVWAATARAFARIRGK
jgi:hypothetical protein